MDGPRDAIYRVTSHAQTEDTQPHDDSDDNQDDFDRVATGFGRRSNWLGGEWRDDRHGRGATGRAELLAGR